MGACVLYYELSNVQIDGRRGYVNKAHVQETRVYQRDLQHTVPTEFYKAAIGDEERKEDVAAEVNVEKTEDHGQEKEEPTENTENEVPTEKTNIEVTDKSKETEFETSNPELVHKLEVLIFTGILCNQSNFKHFIANANIDIDETLIDCLSDEHLCCTTFLRRIMFLILKMFLAPERGCGGFLQLRPGGESVSGGHPVLHSPHRRLQASVLGWWPGAGRLGRGRAGRPRHPFRRV